MSSSHILGVGSTGPRRRWTLARVLKGSQRSLRVMAPPPLLYAYHTLGVFRHHLWCLSTPPQCGIPTFTVGTCSRNVKIKSVVNYCRVWFCATITVTTARFCTTITVTTARLVLRNNYRYNGAFGFAQQ